MRCHACDSPAIIAQPARCKEHFVAEFEARVHATIEEFSMIPPGARVAVACSGGKDSLTILKLLHARYPDVTAITVDEGIAGYREKTMRDVVRWCAAWHIPLKIVSYEEFAGATLDAILRTHKLHACTVCGAFRRHLIARAAKEFDVLVTGHNLDDEAQTVMMNLLKGNTDILPRGGPVSGIGAIGFTPRVKPLIRCTEKEVMTYAWLHGLVSEFTECPNAKLGYRSKVRAALNRLESQSPGTLRKILERFLALKATFPAQDRELPRCTTCGEPSSRDVCAACMLLETITASSAQRTSHRP